VNVRRPTRDAPTSSLRNTLVPQDVNVESDRRGFDIPHLLCGSSSTQKHRRPSFCAHPIPGLIRRLHDATWSGIAHILVLAAGNCLRR